MEEINDSYIKKIFLTKCGFVSSKEKAKYSKDKNSDIHKYITNRYKDSLSFEESLLRICWDINIHPKCKTCGNPVTVNYKKNKFYNQYCCLKCVQQDPNIIKKKEITYFNKTGYKHNSKNPESQNKTKKTCLEKYGVEYVTQSKEMKEKSKQTCLEKYGVEYSFQSENNKEKSKQTCLEKYGTDQYIKTNAFREKSKQTCLEKYGEISFSKTKKFKEIFNIKYEVIQNKINKTKKKHKSFASSKPEEELYLYIKEKFPLVERQYRDERYPWNCDFYIPELDLFLELQGSWTHGKHAYNPDSIGDNNILIEWKNRNTKYYNNAIKTWTISDVKKRETAKENNLNFYEVWSLNDGMKLIDMLYGGNQ